MSSRWSASWLPHRRCYCRSFHGFSLLRLFLQSYSLGSRVNTFYKLLQISLNFDSSSLHFILPSAYGWNSMTVQYNVLPVRAVRPGSHTLSSGLSLGGEPGESCRPGSSLQLRQFSSPDGRLAVVEQLAVQFRKKMFLRWFSSSSLSFLLLRACCACMPRTEIAFNRVFLKCRGHKALFSSSTLLWKPPFYLPLKRLVHLVLFRKV